MDKRKEQHYFKMGIVFVLVAYLIVKIVDNYPTVFDIVRGILSILSPFIIAFIIAYIINPIVNFFEKRVKLGRGLSILASYGVLVVVVILIIVFIAPIFVDSIRELVKDIPTYVTMANDWITSQNFELDFLTPDKVNEIVDKVVKSIPNFLSAIGGSIYTIYSTTMSVILATANFFIGVVVSCFILAEKEKFALYSKKLTYIIFRERYGNKVLEVTRVLNANIGKYLVGKFIDSIFVAILAIVGLLIIKSKYAILLGTVFGIANMIPYFGPILTTGVAVFINLFTSPMQALVTLILLLIIQQIENLFLDPKIVGSQLGLSPFFTLLAVSIGGKLFGIPGMILASPVMSIIKYNATKQINMKYEKLPFKEKI